MGWDSGDVGSPSLTCNISASDLLGSLGPVLLVSHFIFYNLCIQKSSEGGQSVEKITHLPFCSSSFPPKKNATFQGEVLPVSPGAQAVPICVPCLVLWDSDLPRGTWVLVLLWYT